MGKLLRVDLTKGKIIEEQLKEEITKLYGGASGYSAKILWDELRQGVEPLSPDNKFIFSTGPLTGTLVPCSGSYNICFKSPLTGVWRQARSGGFFPAKLKHAGYDLIVLEGKSANPVYLSIQDGKAELKDAKSLWGLTTHETTKRIMEEIGDSDVGVACIGPAGEKLVRFANVMTIMIEQREDAAEVLF